MNYQLKKPLLPIQNDYDVIETIFAARGINPEQVCHYLQPSDNDIYDPMLLDNVEAGAKMLAMHIKNQDKTIMIVDCDCDGYTSSALFLNYLNSLFPYYVQNNITYCFHSGKQHGLSDMINNIPNDTKFVICIDSSSNDYEQHKQLKARGIDILVLDHHEAEYISPDACVINNQLCNYPNKNLSGVGVAYKFCQYIDSVLGINRANDFLDLVAVGIIGDVMGLRNFETKRLIDKGLSHLKNPFIQEVASTQDYSISRGGGLCPFTVSFYIVPLINGTIRMGNKAEKALLFEAMLDYKAKEPVPSTKRGCKGQMETKVSQACRNCTSIKRKQAKVVDNDMTIIEHIIEDKELYKNKIIAVKLDNNHSINKNITGLVANKIMAKYQHPILILSEGELNGKKTWSGSGRGYDTPDFNDFKEFINNSHLANYATGHAGAFGASFNDENFDTFIKYSNEILKNCSFSPCTTVDFIWTPHSFKGSDILDIAELNNIWGQELEKPYIAIENILLFPNQNITLLSKDKKPTLKIQLDNGVSLIKFGSSQEEYDKLTQYPNGAVRISIIGTCKMNEWAGEITPQIEVDDYEITELIPYYF